MSLDTRNTWVAGDTGCLGKRLFLVSFFFCPSIGGNKLICRTQHPVAMASSLIFCSQVLRIELHGKERFWEKKPKPQIISMVKRCSKEVARKVVDPVDG